MFPHTPYLDGEETFSSFLSLIAFSIFVYASSPAAFLTLVSRAVADVVF